MSGKRGRRGSNLFKDSWLSHGRFSSWLQKESPTSAKCKLCGTVIDIKNIGVSSLTSHVKYEKHQLKEPRMSTATVSFFAAKSVPSTSSSTKPSSSKRATVEDFIVSANVLNAEIKWSLKVVMSYFSFCSCERIGNLFAGMFSDSETAKKYSLGRTKCSYFVKFDIAPHFKTMLFHNVQKYLFLLNHLMSL